MSLWKLINFEALSEKDGEAMVEQLPELEEMLLSVIDENVQEIKDSDSTVGFSDYNSDWYDWAYENITNSCLVL